MIRKHYAKLSMPIRSSPASVYEAFVDPRQISRFWLKRSADRLERGIGVTWEFMVPGAVETTTASTLVPGERIRFRWSDGVKVDIAIEKVTRGSSIVRIVSGPFSSTAKAVDATEGFCIVLCDLKLFLESGTSPGLVRAKARLISA